MHGQKNIKLCNFIAVLTFTAIRQNSDMKIFTFYCRILYLNYKTHLIIIRHVREAQSSELFYPILCVILLLWDS